MMSVYWQYLTTKSPLLIHKTGHFSNCSSLFVINTVLWVPVNLIAAPWHLLYSGLKPDTFSRVLALTPTLLSHLNKSLYEAAALEQLYF